MASFQTIESTETKTENDKKYSSLASDEAIQSTMEALKKNGIEVYVFDSEEPLKKKLFELLPENAEVMNMKSQTLKTLGISEVITNSGKYDSVRNKFKSLDLRSQRKIGSDADYSVGSVHAVTENGEILIASATGSQLSAYAYSSGKIIWIVGTQKIVKNREEGFKRIYEYCFPLEDAAIRKLYNVGSKVGKILIINSESPGRLTLMFLKQNIGF